ncbi:MAG: hypothetical protein K1060chlam5_00893 [Candidatus Anoxychlamydiales bacterium]|nr:hypothetical protein [Candidatus Anoxychlamydiales bacterium]
MKDIEDSVIIKAPKDRIFKVWADNYFPQGYTIDKKNGKILTKNGGKLKYKLLDIKKNESLTILFKSFFSKMIFYYTLEKSPKGCLVRCRVKMKGIFSFLLQKIIGKKIKSHITESLLNFKQQLEYRL